MFVLKFDVESAYALGRDSETDENWAVWIRECVSALKSIATILKRNDAPATFFILGNVLERAPDEVAGVLDDPLFDVQSHTYSHLHIIDDDPYLVYMPAMHPWSVYRFDPEVRHAERLIHMARDHQVPLANCMQIYEMHSASR